MKIKEPSTRHDLIEGSGAREPIADQVFAARSC